MDTDEVIEMYTDIVLGVPKEQSKWSHADPQLWNRIVTEVADMKAQGIMPEMFSEVPDIHPVTRQGSGQALYSPDQPRDDHGKWGEGSGGSAGKPLTGPAAEAVIPAPPRKATAAVVEDYQTTFGYAINAQLRGDTRSAYYPKGSDINQPGQIRQDVKALDRAFRQAPPLTAPVQVERGVARPAKAFGLEDDLAGTVFTDHGYVSATTSSDMAKSFAETPPFDRPSDHGALIQITVPAGEKALLLPAHEALLPRGTTFKITGDGPAAQGAGYKRVITMEVVPS